MSYIVTLLPGSGIGSVIVGIIGALYYLEKNNIQDQLIINYCFASEPVKCLINHFLDQDNISIVKFVNFPSNNGTKDYLNIYTELFFTKLTVDIYHWLQDNNIDYKIFCDIFKKIWILKQSIKNDCDSLNNYDICINLRRGDKITLESHLLVQNVERYIDEIEKINLIQPKIFHTSDEYNTFLEIKQIKKDWDIETFNTIEEKGYFLGNINNAKNDNYNYNHVLKFLKQLHVMTNSKYFIGTLSTNVGFLVQLLREKRNNSYNVYIK